MRLPDSKEAETLGYHTTTRAPKWPLSVQASQRSFDQYLKDLKIGISSVSLVSDLEPDWKRMMIRTVIVLIELEFVLTFIISAP